MACSGRKVGTRTRLTYGRVAPAHAHDTALVLLPRRQQRYSAACEQEEESRHWFWCSAQLQKYVDVGARCGERDSVLEGEVLYDV